MKSVSKIALFALLIMPGIKAVDDMSDEMRRKQMIELFSEFINPNKNPQIGSKVYAEKMKAICGDENTKFWKNHEVLYKLLDSKMQPKVNALVSLFRALKDNQTKAEVKKAFSQIGTLKALRALKVRYRMN